ncbi:MAG: chloride channel protein [Planctomycetes bacterium]|nr:chloride channel protein [Planctomycetota bacterium]
MSERRRFGRLFWRDPHNQFLMLTVLVGLMGAAGAIAFRAITAWVTRLVMGSENVVEGASSLALPLRIGLPALGGLIGGLIARRFVRTGGTMGIAQIMEVVAVGRRTVSFRQSLARCASSLFVISSGGSEGREGPIIQIGAASASLLGRLTRVAPERARVLVACGMAAGVAGAYNTPISGTLFVVELVMGSFTMSVFGPAIVAAFVSSVLTRLLLGDAPLYDVDLYAPNSLPEYLLCPVIGLLTGCGSVLFLKLLRATKKAFKRTGLRDEWRMGLAGLGVGVLGIWFPEVWGNGFEGTNFILDARPAMTVLLALFFLKMLATNLTVGSGGVGGVFTPALMCGAAVGGMVAVGTDWVDPELAIPSSGLALLGMGGFLAGMTRAPLLSIIMMVELTQNEHLVLPMMIVALTSVAGAGFFSRRSVYVEELHESGIEWHDRPESTALANLKVKDIVRRDVNLVPQSLPITEVIRIFLHTRAFYLFVKDHDGRLAGAIDLHDLKNFLGDEDFADPAFSAAVIAADVAREVPFVCQDESLVSASEKIWGVQDLGWMPVVDNADDRIFIGMITRRDLLGAVDREILRGSRFLARIDHEGLHGRELSFLELPDQHRIQQIDVPANLRGSAIGASDLRRRYGISILAIQRVSRSGEIRKFVPGPEDRLERGDKLIVLATREAIDRLEADQR